ncbi:MAG: efflux RND transporter periplasmic adaptor subunit, partial [Pseudomonadota bacterium]|nr:efflux RND transporter periplasmic adaptor subunit [Pseudomonadota bacterium]
YVPEWIAAQEEFLTARRIATGPNDGIIDGARQRMRLVGMTDAQIGAVAASGRVQPRVTISAPRSGVITELTVRDGMTVSAGAPLFRINGIASVWVNAELPENIATQIRVGTPVEARTPALPGTVLQGKVGALLGEVNPATRTVKARIELPNPSGQLVPGLFATLQFNGVGHAEVLLIPSEAVIQTGTRSVVMVAQDQGKFTAVEVETGTEANGQTEIRKGLTAGQKVVVSGQFLIDSEASLKGAITRMSGAPAGGGDAMSTPIPSATSAPSSAVSATPTTPATPPTPTQTLHHGVGKIESISKDEITISHGPIASLKWDAMTMGFQLPPGGLPAKVAVGDTVAFDIRALPDGQFGIAHIAPSAPAATAQKASAMSMPPTPNAANATKPAGGKP